jgi:hypothetical protein
MRFIGHSRILQWQSSISLPLTGAIIALGNEYAGLYANDDDQRTSSLGREGQR